MQVKTNKSVAVEIRAIRESLGFTQEQFAARIGAHTSAVQKWEAGRFDPHPRTMDLIRGLRRRSKSRLSQAQTEELHLALDVLLEHAPMTVIEDFRGRLLDRAGRYGYNRGEEEK